jgi:hypothetical protein
LVAEEVERVYPELVTYGLDGKVETVRYSMLTSMLLNELQKQTRELQNQTRENQGQAEQLSKLSAQVAAVNTSTRGCRVKCELPTSPPINAGAACHDGAGGARAERRSQSDCSLQQVKTGGSGYL